MLMVHHIDGVDLRQSSSVVAVRFRYLSGLIGIISSGFCQLCPGLVDVVRRGHWMRRWSVEISVGSRPDSLTVISAIRAGGGGGAIAWAAGMFLCPIAIWAQAAPDWPVTGRGVRYAWVSMRWEREQTFDHDGRREWDISTWGDRDRVPGSCLWCLPAGRSPVPDERKTASHRHGFSCPTSQENAWRAGKFRAEPSNTEGDGGRRTLARITPAPTSGLCTGS